MDTITNKIMNTTADKILCSVGEAIILAVINSNRNSLERTKYALLEQITSPYKPGRKFSKGEFFSAFHFLVEENILVWEGKPYSVVRYNSEKVKEILGKKYRQFGAVLKEVNSDG